MSRVASYDHTTIRDSNCTIIGDFNKIYGNNVVVKGDHNHIYGNNCRVTGDHNHNHGVNNTAAGDFNSDFGLLFAEPEPVPEVEKLKEEIKKKNDEIFRLCKELEKLEREKKEKKENEEKEEEPDSDVLKKLQVLEKDPDLVKKIQALKKIQKEEMISMKRKQKESFGNTIHMLFDKFVDAKNKREQEEAFLLMKEAEQFALAEQKKKEQKTNEKELETLQRYLAMASGSTQK